MSERLDYIDTQLSRLSQQLIFARSADEANHLRERMDDLAEEKELILEAKELAGAHE